MDFDTAISDGKLTVRVTPKAASNRIAVENGVPRVWVTAAPENGKATKAVIAILAGALGVPKSKIVLIQGAKARTKTFRIER